MRGTSRRAFIRAGSLTAVAVPLAPVLAACTTEPAAPPPPDPLAELAAVARADAATAEAIAAAVPDLATNAGLVAKARGEHALALQREVDRERPPKTSASATRPETSPAPAPPEPAAAKASLVEALKSAEQAASELITTVPRYRAGLLGSVAAGCAGLREVFA